MLLHSQKGDSRTVVRLSLTKKNIPEETNNSVSALISIFMILTKKLIKYNVGIEHVYLYLRFILFTNVYMFTAINCQYMYRYTFLFDNPNPNPNPSLHSYPGCTDEIRRRIFKYEYTKLYLFIYLVLWRHVSLHRQEMQRVRCRFLLAIKI